MSNAIGLECQFFIMSIMWGMILLVIYDMIRTFRRVIKHQWIIVAIEDILYWLLSAFLIFRMMYQLNNGVIRGFSIVGMALGMIFYSQAFSELVVTWLTKVCMMIFMKPVRVVVTKEKQLVLFLNKKIGKIGNRLLKDLKKKEKASKIKEKEG